MCDDTHTVAVMSNMVGEMPGESLCCHESSMVIAYVLEMMS